MGNNHKSKAERLKGDLYIGVCFQALETLEHLCLIQTRVNYWQTKAWILTSFWPNRARVWMETKEMGTRQWSKQEQLILVQGEDSKKGHLIYLTWKGSFQVILYKMSRFLSGKLKKHTKLAKIAFLLTDWSFLWTLTNLTDLVIPWQYPMQFMVYENTYVTFCCIWEHFNNSTFRGDMPPLSYNALNNWH